MPTLISSLLEESRFPVQIPFACLMDIGVTYCATQRALNGSGYTVWIDEAGIRAGQKWRNEIADGIKVGCHGHMDVDCIC